LFFRPRRDGSIELQLDDVIRDVVSRACVELRESLVNDADDPSLRRLFPTAYPDDVERERAYEQLVRDDLLRGRLLALDTVVATAGDDTITVELAEKWMAALNAVRLTLGTRLDVSEDHDSTEMADDDPRFPQYLVYDLFGLMLGSLIAVVAP
jgi:hypothetical protein